MAFEHLSPVWTHLSNTLFERGDGIYVYDTDGSRYIDFTSGIGVTNTGHCHPKVVQAIQEQASKMIFSQMNCMISNVAVELTDALLPLLPRGMDSLFFSNSGAEATEGAVKLAKMATGRTNVIAFQNGFHGRTALTMALTGSKTIYRSGYQPLPSGIFFAPYPYSYRYGWDEPTTIAWCVRELEMLLKSQTAPEETAAILIEPVLGEGGYVPAPPQFLRELRRLCDETGILLIMDEIQTGFGRTGEFWAHTRSGITPDILIMAKGLASGMPMSAIAAPRALMEKWTPGSHGGTYGGGNAVVMAAAIATIAAIQEDNLVQNACDMGEHLTRGLRDLQNQYPVIGDVRGWGLMVGTEFTSADVAKKVAKECLDNHLLLLTCGTYGNVIRWIPPLVVNENQMNDALAIFADALQRHA